jgi:hypothetical protein
VDRSHPPAAAPSLPAVNFSADLTQVARSLRTALSTMLMSLGLDPQDPQALVRKWGLNRQLSWKIAKIIQLHDPFVALQHLPGSEGLGILLKTGEQAGASAQAIDAVRQAVQAFDRLIETHCGDRSTFEIMGAGLSSAEPARQQQEALRKQFFLGASAIWGAQLKVNLVAWFVAPGADAGTADMVSVKAWLGFRRLRDNLSWVMSRHMSKHDDGAFMAIPEPEALDARSHWSVPLMRDFCSEPLPEISVKEDGGRLTASLAPGPIGNAGQISCLFGKLHRGLPHARTPQDRYSKFICDLNIPSEVAILDLYVHRSMAYAIPPTVSLASLIEPREPDADRSRLPLHEPVIELGAPSPAPLTLEMPRYGEMVERVYARTGWAPEEFVGFRVKMAYPPLPTVLMMRYELPV